MKCNPEPCNTCPYRKDTPAGIWAKEEYDKLPAWDNQYAMAGTFLCHNDKEAVCRGWLEVHHRNFSVRIACGKIEWNDTNQKPCKAKLFLTGAAARIAGIKGIKRPSSEAQKKIQHLLETKST